MDLTVKKALYVLACLVVPILWGFVIVWASNAIERRLRRNSDREVPPIEFYI